MKKLFVLKLFFLFSLMNFFNIYSERAEISKIDIAFITAYYASSLALAVLSKDENVKCVALCSFIFGLISDSMIMGKDKPCIQKLYSMNHKELKVAWNVWGFVSFCAYFLAFEKCFFNKLRII